MENLELIFTKEKEVIKVLIDMILELHPIVDNRYHILYPRRGEPMTPEMEILFNFYQDKNLDYTRITIFDGWYDSKSSVSSPMILFNGLLSEYFIHDFIGRLLTDHDYFRDIIRDNKTIELPLCVDARIENMCGIGCGEINLKLDFSDYPDCEIVMDKYLKVIVTKFYDKLKTTCSFKREFSYYCELMRSYFIDSSSIDELKKFITVFNGEDLCNAIFSIPDVRFFELYSKFNDENELNQLVKK